MRTTNKKSDGIAKRAKAGEELVQTDVLGKIGTVGTRISRADYMMRIVARCQQGEQQAFRQLFDETVAGVHRHLSLLIGPGPDIDDLVQLVYLNIFNSIRRFRGQSAFSTWLFRITINVARQEIRQRGRRRRLDSVISESSRVSATRIEKTPELRLSTQQQVYGVLDHLSVKKRETFILYSFEGYSLEEIARLLGSSVSTIGSRLQSARKEIVRILAARKLS